jgi:peptidoglycan endopeptidase LytF
MSRRDTIIIAVLVNLGLLAVLFMTAIHLDEDGVSDPMEASTTLVEVKKVPELELERRAFVSAQKNTGDELDNALQDFVSTSNMQPVTIDDQEVSYIDKPAEKVMATKVIAAKVVNTEQKDPPESLAQYAVVTVKKGDVLEKIAKANGTTVGAIKEANQLKNEKLSIGKVLRIPVSSARAATAVAATTPVSAKQESTKLIVTADILKPLEVLEEPIWYVIKNGDNPWKIAKQFKVKVDDLLKMNSLNEEKARNLKVGDKIRVK